MRINAPSGRARPANALRRMLTNRRGQMSPEKTQDSAFRRWSDWVTSFHPRRWHRGVLRSRRPLRVVESVSATIKGVLRRVRGMRDEPSSR